MDGQWQKPLYLECYFYLFPTVRLLVVRLKRNYKIPIFQVLMLQKCMNKKNKKRGGAADVPSCPLRFELAAARPAFFLLF